MVNSRETLFMYYRALISGGETLKAFRHGETWFCRVIAPLVYNN